MSYDIKVLNSSGHIIIDADSPIWQLTQTIDFKANDYSPDDAGNRKATFDLNPTHQYKPIVCASPLNAGSDYAIRVDSIVYKSSSSSVYDKVDLSFVIVNSSVDVYIRVWVLGRHL